MGQIHLTVYSEVFDSDTAMQGEYPSTVLVDEMLDAPTFTEYELPPLPEQEGYRALGYVLIADSSQSYLEDLHTETGEPHVIGSVALGSSLTPDDLGIVPQSIEGPRA